MDEDLAQKRCEPCEGKGQALSLREAQSYLRQVSHWNLNQDGKSITRDYVMKNFMAAIRLIEKVAELAEAQGHHPDLHLAGYRRLRIELSTHAVNGLSENDFILAAQINQLPAELK